MLYYLCYVSTATQLLTASQLEGLLEECRVANKARGVTGALLYRDGNFMQVLEGEEVMVRVLYEMIRADPRHHDVTFMIDGHAPRQFDRWSMAFRDLAEDTSHLGSAYSDFFNPHPTTGDYPGRPTMAQRLLLSFRRTLTPM